MLDKMTVRIDYRGGKKQQDRMNVDKLKSLQKALLYSYQAATAILPDGREFRCLINPDKIDFDEDNKILSIPFKDICLNGGKQTPPNLDITENHSDEGIWNEMNDLVATLTYYESDSWEEMVSSENVEDVPDPENVVTYQKGIQDIKITEGDVIIWKENKTRWLVYLRKLEETAYFRASLRRCRHQLTLGNGSSYWVYVKGPTEKNINWNQKNGNYFNKLNYTLTMYVNKTNETLKYFNRFKKVVINETPWEVQIVDRISLPGLLVISLKETFSNSIENDIEKVVQKAQEKETPEPQVGIHISGLQKIYPYESHKYELKNYNGHGKWKIINPSKKDILEIKRESNNAIELYVKTGKKATFTLVYEEYDILIAHLEIEIGSL